MLSSAETDFDIQLSHNQTTSTRISAFDLASAALRVPDTSKSYQMKKVWIILQINERFLYTND